MIIKTIHSMYWGDAAHTAVGLIADTDTEENLLIGTPYDETSIIWNAVKEFPADQIAEYTPPTAE